MKKPKECIRCGQEKIKGEISFGCYIGIPGRKINKYHRYKPLNKELKNNYEKTN